MLMMVREGFEGAWTNLHTVAIPTFIKLSHLTVFVSYDANADDTNDYDNDAK